MGLNRRTFLLAGAAVAASAAERPIRAAVYGLGHAHASGKVRTLRAMPSYELAGLCEPKRPELLAHPDYAGLERLDRDAMLGDRSIELIVVEADVQHGLGYAHEAIGAGKHVHLDKPPGEDLVSLADLFEKAKRRSLAVQMGYMWRYHVAMGSAIQMARSGELGDVYAVRATINKPISPEERSELAYFRGGMMFELGCHMIDRIVDLLGKPRKVTGWLRHDGSFEDGLADNTLAVLEYEKALAQVYIAAMQPNGNRYRAFQILGTKGTATVSPFSPDGTLAVDLEGKGPSLTAIMLPRLVGPYQPDFAELAAFIRKGETLRYTPDHDLAVQEALLQACGIAS